MQYFLRKCGRKSAISERNIIKSSLYRSEMLLKMCDSRRKYSRLGLIGDFPLRSKLTHFATPLTFFLSPLKILNLVNKFQDVQSGNRVVTE